MFLHTNNFYIIKIIVILYSIFLTALYHKLKNLSETFTGTSTPKSVDEFVDGPHPEDSFLSSSVVCFSLASGTVGQSFLDLPSSLSFCDFSAWFLSCLDSPSSLCPFTTCGSSWRHGFSFYSISSGDLRLP